VSAVNPLRGEAQLTIGGTTMRLRPSFAALVAAEQELGPLFALVERAAAGGLTLAELVALCWHCRDGWPADLERDVFAEALVTAGIAGATPALRVLLGQILAGR
jgi:Phage tail tube protein, GTA-gp10